MMKHISIIISIFCILALPLPAQDDRNPPDAAASTAIAATTAADEKPADSSDTPENTAPKTGTMFVSHGEKSTSFTFKAGGDNYSLDIESPFVDMSICSRTEAGVLSTGGHMAIPMIGPLWALMTMEFGSGPGSYLYVSGTGAQLKLGNITASLTAHLSPDYMLTGAGIKVIAYDLFYIADKESQDRYTDGKLTHDQFRSCGYQKSFGLNRLAIGLDYEDSTLLDNPVFDFNLLHFNLQMDWKLNCFLFCFDTHFDPGFDDFYFDEGIGIITKDIKFTAMYRVFNILDGASLPPQITLSITYMLNAEL
jgi:hypothetical protein